MDDSDYSEIARHFFAQFLEMKARYERGDRPVDYDKQLAAYKKANDKLKEAAQEFAEENKRLEEALALADENAAKLQGQINELIINLGLANEKLAGLGVIKREAKRSGYRFTEHMSEESRREWDKLMRGIPGYDKEAE